MRADLSPGLQLAQTGHALVDICLRNPDLVRGWWRDSNNLVVLAVESEVQLLSFDTAFAALGVERSLFAEPDLGNEFTALAAAPGPWVAELVSCLPLAGELKLGLEVRESKLVG